MAMLKLCTFGYVDDVMFSHNGQAYATVIRRMQKETHTEIRERNTIAMSAPLHTKTRNSIILSRQCDKRFPKTML